MQPILSCLRNGLRRGTAIASDRRGATAFEFALLLPLITAMLAGTLQYGVLYFTYDSMLHSARNGARAMALGTVSTTDIAITAKASLPGWVDRGLVTVTSASVGANSVQTTISMPSSTATVMPLMPMPATIDATVTMLLET